MDSRISGKSTGTIFLLHSINMETKYIIMSGGDGERWGNHLGVPKHLIEINNEKLIERTTRLLIENEQENIIILGPKKDDERYHITGAITIPTSGLPDCFWEMFTDLTKEDYKYVLLGGDVFYTENCINKIVHGYDWIGRLGPSNCTGQLHEELWSVTVTPENKKNLQGELEISKRRGGRPNAWTVYFQLRKKCTLDWFNFDDMTCDFDTPDDFNNWNKETKNGTAAD